MNHERIEVGRMPQDIKAVYFEVPCPFDHLEDTKIVADSLIFPVAGRYQEYKLGTEKYSAWFDPPIAVKDGKMSVPTGPGVGIKDLEGLLQGAVEGGKYAKTNAVQFGSPDRSLTVAAHSEPRA